MGTVSSSGATRTLSGFQLLLLLLSMVNIFKVCPNVEPKPLSLKAGNPTRTLSPSYPTEKINFGCLFSPSLPKADDHR